LYYAVNAVAELSGPPLHERRLLLEFPARANAAQRPSMTDGLYALLGVFELDTANLIRDWLPHWKLAFESAMENSRVDSHVHPVRVNYYERAIQTMLASAEPRAALWPLLQTWTLAAEVLSEGAMDPWRSACGQLGLTAIGMEEHVHGLDHFLDEVEGLLDELALQHGLETSTSA